MGDGKTESKLISCVVGFVVAHLTLASFTGSCHRLVSQIVIRNTQTIKNLFTSHNNVKLIIF
jgi:hypothetical protein